MTLFDLGSHAQSAAGAKHHSVLMHWLVSLGGVGVFGISFIDASVVPLPIPGTTDLLLLILIAHGGNPWLLAGLGVAGSLIGGFLTWSTGKKGGEDALRRYIPRRYYKRITGWVQEHGALAVASSAMLPPPVPLLPFLLAAGALSVPRSRFVLSFTGGRAIRYGVVAWLGVRYGRHMVHWWNLYLADYSDKIGWTIFALFAAALAWGLWKWKRGQREARPAGTSAQPAVN
jgi:membrane protein DedA with SNARE-associated domain